MLVVVSRQHEDRLDQRFRNIGRGSPVAGDRGNRDRLLLIQSRRPFLTRLEIDPSRVSDRVDPVDAGRESLRSPVGVQVCDRRHGSQRRDWRVDNVPVREHIEREGVCRVDQLPTSLVLDVVGRSCDQGRDHCVLVGVSDPHPEFGV